MITDKLNLFYGGKNIANCISAVQKCSTFVTLWSIKEGKCCREHMLPSSFVSIGMTTLLVTTILKQLFWYGHSITIQDSQNIGIHRKKNLVTEKKIEFKVSLYGGLWQALRMPNVHKKVEEYIRELCRRIKL